MRPLVAFLAACAVIGTAALAQNAAATPKKECKLIRIEEWRLRPDQYLPTIDGAINGQKVGIVIDTGLSKSALVFRSTVSRLGLPRSRAYGLDIVGVGGESQGEIATIRELRIGDATRKHWRAQVVGEQDVSPHYDVLFGHRFFHNIDLEFDLPNKVVRLFQPRDCEGASLGYWASQGASVVPIEIDHHIEFTVHVNGKPVRAMLDSAATSSSLNLSAARRLGVEPQTPGVSAGGCVYGFGPHGVDSWIGQFESIAIGDEMIRNPKLRFFDLDKHSPSVKPFIFGTLQYKHADMILGADFLHSHRVLVSRSQNKLYFTHSGGTVFPVRVAKPC